jgi:hypothetical protein
LPSPPPPPPTTDTFKKNKKKQIYYENQKIHYKICNLVNFCGKESKKEKKIKEKNEFKNNK